MQKDRLACHDNVSAWNQCPQEQHREIGMKCTYLCVVAAFQNREARHWPALPTIERLRQSPDTLSASTLSEFIRRVLDDTIRGIGNDGVDRLRPSFFEPVESVGPQNLIG